MYVGIKTEHSLYKHLYIVCYRLNKNCVFIYFIQGVE